MKPFHTWYSYYLLQKLITIRGHFTKDITNPLCFPDHQQAFVKSQKYTHSYGKAQKQCTQNTTDSCTTSTIQGIGCISTTHAKGQRSSTPNANDLNCNITPFRPNIVQNKVWEAEWHTDTHKALWLWVKKLQEVICFTSINLSLQSTSWTIQMSVCLLHALM